ncbi:MAG: hypothetical protein IJE89_04710 [Bacilli bacterium]|nr:hypothetical protein [Bacilli bacterium]
MRDYKNDLVSRIIDLYNMYEKYMWIHDDVKLNILIQDNAIAFYLYNNKEEIDNIVLTFSGQENNLYKYISIKILLNMMKDVVVHRDENEFHNRVLKPYLRIIVNDDNILETMIILVNRQLLEIINEENNLVKDIETSIINPIFYPNRVIKKLDERIEITRKLLKNGVVV